MFSDSFFGYVAGSENSTERGLHEFHTNPFQPRLDLYPLSGQLTGCYAVRLTSSIRVTLTLFITEKEIVLLDIGSHDEVYL